MKKKLCLKYAIKKMAPTVLYVICQWSDLNAPHTNITLIFLKFDGLFVNVRWPYGVQSL